MLLKFFIISCFFYKYTTNFLFYQIFFVKFLKDFDSKITCALNSLSLNLFL